MYLERNCFLLIDTAAWQLVPCSDKTSATRKYLQFLTASPLLVFLSETVVVQCLYDTMKSYLTFQVTCKNIMKCNDC